MIVIPLLVTIPSSLMYPMPYAWFLASCSMGISYALVPALDLMFPFVVAVAIALGFCSAPFIYSILPLDSGIACLAICTLG